MRIARVAASHAAVLVLPMLLQGCGPAPRTGSAEPAGVPQAFGATGNEPGWRLDVSGPLTFAMMNGAPLTIATPRVETLPDGQRYSGSDGGRTIAATVRARLCRDTMTGMPRPLSVEVAIDGTDLQGCGGDPATLLQGEWIVQRAGDISVAPMPPVTMRFGTDGRVTARASCNSYSGGYTITGEGLQITEVAATLRACADGLMAQEAAVLGVLRGVQRFDVEEDGTLVLYGSDGNAAGAPGRRVTGCRQRGRDC